MYRWSLSHPPIPILSIESKLVTMATQAPETFVFFFFFLIYTRNNYLADFPDRGDGESLVT